MPPVTQRYESGYPALPAYGEDIMFVEATVLHIARDFEPATMTLDPDILGITDGESYRAFVAAWKTAWHKKVAACREAKAGMRLSGTSHEVQRGLSQARREALRIDLRHLHALRVAVKSASRDRVQADQAA